MTFIGLLLTAATIVALFVYFLGGGLLGVLLVALACGLLLMAAG